MSCLMKCSRSCPSWWARQFSIMASTFSGGLGKYSNQCEHQFTVCVCDIEISAGRKKHWHLPPSWEKESRENLEHAPDPPPSSNCNILWLTQQGSEDLEGDKLVVLAELHKREHHSWKVLCLSKYGRPVRQSGQCPGGMHTFTSVNPTQSKLYPHLPQKKKLRQTIDLRPCG